MYQNCEITKQTKPAKAWCQSGNKKTAATNSRYPKSSQNRVLQQPQPEAEITPPTEKGGVLPSYAATSL
jgi:hypothetical protein